MAARSGKLRSFCTGKRKGEKLVCWVSASNASFFSIVKLCSPRRSSRRAICSNGAPEEVDRTTVWCSSLEAPSGHSSRPRMARCGPSAPSSGKSCKTSTPASLTLSSPENDARTSATIHRKVGIYQCATSTPLFFFLLSFIIFAHFVQSFSLHKQSMTAIFCRTLSYTFSPFAW